MLSEELGPQGVEIVTVSLELSGPEASRPFIEAAKATHPSLIDASHTMDALFGVVNIPNVIWIDEDGVIVRPAEPGWADPSQTMPGHLFNTMRDALPKMSRAKTAPPLPEKRTPPAAVTAGQNRAVYADAIRDWVALGPKSKFAMTPGEVIAHSQPRDPSLSAGAAHFELANHLWRAGQRELSYPHFREAHRLQPDNWTYKRQAWSLIGNERVGGEFGRFVQGPLAGEEDDWPFVSDFRSDTAQMQPGQYYPDTMGSLSQQ